MVQPICTKGATRQHFRALTRKTVTFYYAQHYCDISSQVNYGQKSTIISPKCSYSAVETPPPNNGGEQDL
jgi:hypothetical protein